MIILLFNDDNKRYLIEKLCIQLSTIKQEKEIFIWHATDLNIPLHLLI